MLTVTITNHDRALWTGSYAEFQRAHLDRLSVSEFGLLWEHGSIVTNEGQHRITLAFPWPPKGAPRAYMLADGRCQ